MTQGRGREEEGKKKWEREDRRERKEGDQGKECLLHNKHHEKRKESSHEDCGREVVFLTTLGKEVGHGKERRSKKKRQRKQRKRKQRNKEKQKRKSLGAFSPFF